MVIVDPEEHELSAFINVLPAVPDCRVLEIGCGDGRLTRRYASRVGSVLAVDPNAELIAAFRAAGVDANVDVRASSFDQIVVNEHSVDTVLFSWAL